MNIFLSFQTTPICQVKKRSHKEFENSQKAIKIKYSLHVASSDPSLQSLFPSHIHVNGMHSPLLLRQAKSSDEQAFLSLFFTLLSSEKK